MPTFIHHPDGRIYIDGTMIPLAEFMIEEPTYTLPGGMIGRRYDGTRHVLTNGKNQKAGPVPWIEGDGYIANLATYLANIAARNPEPPPPTLTRNEQIAADPDFPTHFDLVQATVAQRKGNPATMDALVATMDALLIKYP